MNITVNKKSINAVLNDRNISNEIINTFNEIIDSELEKENPDFDVIDECANAINEIYSSENIIPAIRLINTKKQVMKYCRHKAHNNNAVKAVVAASLVLIISSATVLNASPALAENVKSFFETVISTLQNISDDTDNQNSEVISIYATFPKGTKEKVSSIDDVDVNKIKITAVTDNGEFDVSPDKCKIIKKIEHTDKGNVVLVAISYEGCACSVAFELEGWIWNL